MAGAARRTTGEIRTCNDGMDPALTFPNGLCVSQDGNEPSKMKSEGGSQSERSNARN
jgi:hypothetical protein